MGDSGGAVSGATPEHHAAARHPLPVSDPEAHRLPLAWLFSELSNPVPALDSAQARELEV